MFIYPWTKNGFPALTGTCALSMASAVLCSSCKAELQTLGWYSGSLESTCGHSATKLLDSLLNIAESIFQPIEGEGKKEKKKGTKKKNNLKAQILGLLCII